MKEDSQDEDVQTVAATTAAAASSDSSGNRTSTSRIIRKGIETNLIRLKTSQS